MLPRPTSDSAQARPPCRSATFRTMARPTPVPGYSSWRCRRIRSRAPRVTAGHHGARSWIDANRLLAYVHQAVQSLVQALERAPQTPASTLSILPPQERQQTLEQFNATQSDFPRQASILY